MPKKLPILLALAFYLSGVFVLFTPLPLLYSFYQQKNQAWIRVIGPVFLLLTGLYLFAIPSLYTLFNHYPFLTWILIPPGIQWMGSLGHLATLFFGIGYFLFFSFVAYLCYQSLSNPKELFGFVTLGSCFLFLVILASYGAYAYFLQENPVHMIDRYFQEAIQELISIQEKQNQALGEIALLKTYQPQLVGYLVLVSPSFLLGSILFVVVVNLALGKRILFPFIPTLREQPLNRWSIPFFGVWFVILSVSLLLLNSYFIHNKALFTVAVNVLIILSFGYLLQGFAIVSFFVEQWQLRPFLRIILYMVMFLFLQVISLGVLGLGFFDSWFDFRKKPRLDIPR